MKHPRLAELVCLGAGLLLATSVPLKLQAQSPATDNSKSSGQTAKPSLPLPELHCDELNLSMEQIEKDARTLQQNLQSSLSGLQKELKDGELMKSEEFAKLRGMAEAFSSQGAAFDSTAAEFSARAQELAEKAQEQAAQVQRQFRAEMPWVDNGVDSDSGWLGLEINEVTADTAKELRLPAQRGVLVQGVAPDSPAEKAGLKEKDVITQYDGQTVEGTIQFRRLVRETPPGRSVTLGIIREGASQTATIVVGEMVSSPEMDIRGSANNPGTFYLYTPPDTRSFSLEPDIADRSTPRLGIEAEDLSGQLGAYFGAPGNTGILVRDVRDGSPAGKAGVKAGDVITQVDGQAVHSLAELREELRSKSGQKSVSIGLWRKGAVMNVTVTIEKPQPTTTSHLTRRAQM